MIQFAKMTVPLLCALLLPVLSGCNKSGSNSTTAEAQKTTYAAETQKTLCQEDALKSLSTSTQADSFDNGCSFKPADKEQQFRRIASFQVCEQLQKHCDTDQETSAEIVAASADGLTLIYTDSPSQQLGFVDISTPNTPTALGVLALNGEPTSIAVQGQYALVAVNTSDDFINVNGELSIISIASRTVVHALNLGGQPDSIAISPDGSYAVIAIENERDEDLEEGEPPQLPAGEIILLELSGEPQEWHITRMPLSGLADLFPTDPEPEFVDINQANIAAITLQENNHIVLIDLATATVQNHFSAGYVDLTNIDTKEESPALIDPQYNLTQVPREPDGIAWIDNQYFVTANEGDLNGGSRGFTVFDKGGNVVFDSGNDLDNLAMIFGHYPDSRSKNKGNEPENVEVGVYGGIRYLFVASERSNLIFVYDITDPAQPIFQQALPAAVAPEGILAMPARNLAIAASEADSRDDKYRSTLNIYEYSNTATTYPTLSSGYRPNGGPLPWGALSGLSASPNSPLTLFAVDDSYYQKNRIFTLSAKQQPVRITQELALADPLSLIAQIPAAPVADPNTKADDPQRVAVFDELDRALLVNDDGTVNLDPEGIAAVKDGFWIVSEGAGTVGDHDHPVNSLNLLLKVSLDGSIAKVVTLPAALNQIQQRYGFEGVAVNNDRVTVAFQRAWGDEQHPRIGVYNTLSENWDFYFYPLDNPESQNGGWVGLSEITQIDSDRLLVLERDNQAGPDAAIKRIYAVDLGGLEKAAVANKELVMDVIPELTTRSIPIPEKLEGLALFNNGEAWMINDNDGVDDNSGETQLINLGKILKQ